MSASLDHSAEVCTTLARGKAGLNGRAFALQAGEVAGVQRDRVYPWHKSAGSLHVAAIVVAEAQEQVFLLLASVDHPQGPVLPRRTGTS